MVEVVGSIPIAPTRLFSGTLPGTLGTPGALLPLPFALLAFRAPRRERSLWTLDTNIPRAAVRPFGLPWHQFLSAKTDAACLVADPNRNLFGIVISLRYSSGGYRHHLAEARSRRSNPPRALRGLTNPRPQVPWQCRVEGGVPTARWSRQRYCERGLGFRKRIGNAAFRMACASPRRQEQGL